MHEPRLSRLVSRSAPARRGRAWSPRWIAVAPLLLACNALVGNVEEIDYVAVSPDAAADGAPGDAARDGATADDREGGGLDADGGARACDTVFCSTFDPPLDQSPWGWSNLYGSGAATLTTTTNGFTSAPFALSAKASGGTSVLRFLARDLVAASTLTFDLDLRLAVVPSTVALADVVRFACNGQSTLTLWVSPNECGLRWDTLGTSDSSPPIALPVGEWRHLGVSLTSGSASLTVDGGAPSTSVHDCSQATRISLGVAADIPAGEGSYEIWIDGIRSTR